MMGVDTKVGNFLLYDNHWVQFFDWILENTTGENIYSDMELNEYGSSTLSRPQQSPKFSLLPPFTESKDSANRIFF